MSAVSRRTLLAAALLASACRPPTTPSDAGPLAAKSPAVAAPRLHVKGAALVDARGQRVRLRGVNRSGTETVCARNWGIFDGPVDSAAVAAIAAWNANAVRVPLNEACWLGINGVEPAYGGAAYQQAIAAFVARLNAAGMVAILELHLSGPDTVRALEQRPMPDRDHSPTFWRQVATAFRDNPAVMFDLFNEPYPDDSNDSAEAWRCWRDGGTCRRIDYQVAGMQELVNAVRATGATNVILLGGVRYGTSLSQWMAYRPADPRNNLAASWHMYDFNRCDSTCWNATVAPTARQVPLVLGEMGENDGGTAFVDALMDWMDARQGSYLAWSWNVWGTPLDVVASYDGTPTPYGRTFRTRFQAAR